jgi:hypothetical protein
MILLNHTPSYDLLQIVLSLVSRIGLLKYLIQLALHYLDVFDGCPLYARPQL